MHYAGWMVVIASVGLILGPDTRWPVAVLVAGPVLLLLILRGSLRSLPRPTPLSGPRSLDVEAQYIRDLQVAIDKGAPSTKAEGHEH